MLHRSGIFSKQRTMIMCNIGKDLNLSSVTSALWPGLVARPHFKHCRAYVADDDDDDVLGDDYDDTYSDIDGPCDEHYTLDD